MRRAVREFSDILDEAAAQQERLLTEAFEAGRALGRREASAKLKARLFGLLSDDGSDDSVALGGPQEFFANDGFAGVDVAGSDGQEHDRRAPPGSVKPAIAKLVGERPGLTTEEVTNATGFKKNSVRGTLWLLSTEEQVERREGRWYPVAQKDEAVGTESEPDAPTASVSGDDALSQPLTDGPEAVEGQVLHEKIDFLE